MPTPNFNFPTINQSDTANVPRDHNALATAIDTAFQQTEYQTATVVGAQIRVTKPSASNRIFFRLTATINAGTPITISTDGGSTSLNLTDNDGANVTSIEKGFAEIVKVGNFFILRSKGISSAQLAELAGKIGAPAVATDDFATQLSKFQDAKDTFGTKLGVPGSTALQEMADDLVLGKKWASGLETTGTSATFTITGLGFTPSIILVSRKNRTNSTSQFALYLAGSSHGLNSDLNMFATSNTIVAGSATTTSGGFTINSGSSNTEFYWIAFE